MGKPQTERDKLVYRVSFRCPPKWASRYAQYVKAGLTGNGYVRSDTQQLWLTAFGIVTQAVTHAVEIQSSAIWRPAVALHEVTVWQLPVPDAPLGL